MKGKKSQISNPMDGSMEPELQVSEKPQMYRITVLGELRSETKKRLFIINNKS